MPGLAASLGLTAAAQQLVDARQWPWLAVALAALGVSAFVFAAGGVAMERTAAGDRDEPVGGGLPWARLGYAVPLVLLAFWRSGDNRLRWDGVLAWVAALAIIAAPPGWHPRWRAVCWLAQGVTVPPDFLVVGAIVAVGAFLRLYRISAVPAEMGCDLPLNQANIAQILDGGWPIFFPSHPGREPLFFYLSAPLCAVFGLGHTTIKVTGALVGLASIPVLYLLGRELYGRAVGVMAAALLSISHWHIIVSRIGLRYVTMPLLLMGAWLLVARAMRTGRARWYAWAGILVGLGFYTYNAFMIAPVWLAGLALVSIVTGRAWRHRAGLWAWLAIVAAVTMIPLGRYVAENPKTYLFRVATRLSDMEAPLPDAPLRALANNMVRSLGMFNVRGDPVFANNVPGYRELGFVSAVCMLLGVGYALWRWRRGANAAVVWTLVVMLLPSALALAFPHEVPGAGRAIGALPPAMLLAALPMAVIGERLREAWRMSGRKSEPAPLTASRVAAAGLGVALLGAVMLEGASVYPLYFERYVWNLPDHNYSISLDMARTIDAFDGNGEAYILAWPYWYDGNAVRAQLRVATKWNAELPGLERSMPPLVGPPGKVLVILHPSDTEGMALLREAFPRGVALEHYDGERNVTLIAFYGER